MLLDNDLLPSKGPLKNYVIFLGKGGRRQMIASDYTWEGGTPNQSLYGITSCSNNGSDMQKVGNLGT